MDVKKWVKHRTIFLMLDANKAYYELKQGMITPLMCFPLRLYMPWYRYHWNPIWIHRLITEVCVQIFNTAEIQLFRKMLMDDRKFFSKMWDTTLNSNKKITHYCALAALSCLVDENEENWRIFSKLEKCFHGMVNDGAYREGTHYAIFVVEEVKKIIPMLFNRHGNRIYNTQLFVDIKNVEQWLNNVSSNNIITPIGDGWPEKVNILHKKYAAIPEKIEYQDMTIYANKDWKVIEHHRQTGFTLHEHAELNGIQAAYKGKWILPGDGMPSYSLKWNKPFDWYRPRNHWITEHWLDLPFLWRFRKDLPRRKIQFIAENLHIFDSGINTIRLPASENIDYDRRKNYENISWINKDFIVEVNGAIYGIKKCKSYITTAYKKQKQVSVVIITGKNLHTKFIPLIDFNKTMEK